MSSDLTLISYSVLALVGRSGASPHDFVQMMRSGRIYQAASPSQYYAEPKRLERLGYLRSSKEPGRTRDRTVYRLTEDGLDALRAWMEAPAALPRVAGEPVIRMLAADLVGEAPVRASILGMRDEIEALRRELDAGEERAATIPHREKYLLLNHRLARAILDAYDAWVDDVARELE
ncbi:MAG TPA: PadR family transcriptional regulator [Gaiellaceae bacterium]|nr:PadR family transcriptional regulator [Gaiellaceae bacterium]